MRTETVFLWFMIYSFIGWLYETILCSATEKKFVYRGFLNGPYCPIYGIGAMIDLYVLGDIDNVVFLFFASMILTCTLEYVTSYIMEKLFHARWWDYSHMRFNINGRVCLLGAVAFGTFSVLFLKYLHPFISSLTDTMPPSALKTVSWVLVVVFCLDIGITLQGFAGMFKKITSYADSLKDEIRSDILRERQKHSEHMDEIKSELMRERQKRSAHIGELKKRLNIQEKRMLAAFPKLSVKNYEDIISELKNKLSSLKNDD